MALYKVLFKKTAEKELRTIPSVYLSKIIGKIKKLEQEPTPVSSESLKNEEGLYRIRQNNYRVIYRINESVKEVVIIKIGHRRDVYR